MQSTIARTIVAGFVSAAIPAAAQPQSATADRPLAAANWTYIRAFAAGTEITITTRSERLGRRVFVSADESELTVVYAAHPALTAAATQALVELAAAHPQSFTGDGVTTTFLSGPIRVGRDGVFDGGSKLVDIDQIVETIDRDDITELDTPGVRYSHEPGWRMAKGLLWTGVGLLGYSVVLLRLGENDRGNEFRTAAGIFAAGGTTLLVIGAARGHHRLPSIQFGRRAVAIQISAGF